MTAREAEKYQDDKPKWLYIKTPQYFRNLELPIGAFAVTTAISTSTGRNKAYFLAWIVGEGKSVVEFDGDVGAIAKITYRKDQ